MQRFVNSLHGKLFLLENYKDIVERDVIQRYNIKYTKVLKELAKWLISNISNEISYNKLKNFFGVRSVHTIKNYISYLENAYLVFLLERFSFKLKEQVLAPKKVYCIDTGLADTIGFKFSANLGKFIENIIALELLRERNLKKQLELYYWKDHQQREVDFVLKIGRRVKQLIQVAAISSEKEIEKTGLTSLLKAGKELRCNNLLVITLDYTFDKKIEGKAIRFIPLWKWLLQR